MSVPLQSPVGRDPLGPLPLLPGFEAMFKKAQQPWRTCQKLEQRAYPVKICSLVKKNIGRVSHLCARPP